MRCPEKIFDFKKICSMFKISFSSLPFYLQEKKDCISNQRTKVTIFIAR
jgi:hypothetical protein